MKYIIYSIAAALAAILAGCTETTKIGPEQPENPAYVEVSSDKLIFDSDGGIASVAVATNAGQWDYVSTGDWFAVTRRDDNTLAVEASINAGPETLTGNIVVSGEKDGTQVTATVTLVQRADRSVNLSAEGTSNCYIARTGKAYKFDATVKGNGKGDGRSEYIAAYGVGISGIAAAELLWEARNDGDKTMSREIIDGAPVYKNGYVAFSTGRSQGNAVIAVKDINGNILWSWHIWVCDDEITSHDHVNPAEQVVAQIMDRNLGALNNEPMDIDNRGMFYQWGRKDPFVPFRSSQERMAVYDAAGAELADDSAASAAFDAAPGWHLADGERLGAAATMEAAVRYPMNFITEIPESTGASYPNWYYVAAGDRLKDDLWGCTDALSDVGAKSIYDPCPPGYRVSHRFVWTAFAPTADAPFSQWYKQGTSVSAKDGLVFTVEGQEIYYPAAGMLFGTTGAARFTKSGWYVWSASPYAPDSPKAGAFVLETIQKKLLGSAARSCGAQVRCMRE